MVGMTLIGAKTAACVFIVNDDGMILAVSRKDDPNKWGLPGGKHESSDETLLHTALRELLEETGLSAAHGEWVHSAVDEVDYLTVTYRVLFSNVSGSLKQEEGGGSVKWVHPSLLIEQGAFPLYNRGLFDAVEIRVK